MNEFIATFHIDWKLMIAQVINFGLVFLALYLLAAKPLKKLIKERGQEIETGLSDAARSKELLEKASAEYKENAVKLRKIANEAEGELKKDLEKLKAENLDKIKTDNEEWEKKRVKQMELDKKTLVEEAKNELSSLVLLATEKIMEEKNK